MFRRMVIIDTETGGLDPLKSSLLSVAAVLLDDDLQIMDTREWFVKEDPLILTEGAWKVNKIDPADIFERGVSALQVTDELSQFVKGHRCEKGKAVIGGHNVTFDIGYLRRLEAMAAREDKRALGWYDSTFSFRFWDTFIVSRLLFLQGRMDKPLTSLSHSCNYFGIEIGNAHRALDDAIATAKLTQRLAGISGEPMSAVTEDPEPEPAEPAIPEEKPEPKPKEEAADGAAKSIFD